MFVFDKLFMKTNGELVEIPVGQGNGSGSQVQSYQATFTADSDMPSGSTLELPEGTYNPETDVLTVNQEGFILIEGYQYSVSNNVITLNLDIPANTVIHIIVLKIDNSGNESSNPSGPNIPPDYTTSEVPLTRTYDIESSGINVNDITPVAQTNYTYTAFLYDNVKTADIYNGEKVLDANQFVFDNSNKDDITLLIQTGHYSTSQEYEFYGYDDDISFNSEQGLEPYKIPDNCIKRYNSISDDYPVCLFQIISKRNNIIVRSKDELKMVHLVIDINMFKPEIINTTNIIPYLRNTTRIKPMLTSDSPMDMFIDARITHNITYIIDKSILSPNANGTLGFFAANNRENWDLIMAKAAIVGDITMMTQQILSSRYLSASKADIMFIAFDDSIIRD